MLDFFELAKTRRSIRAYTGRSVDRKDLEKCVEAARYSPSACNSQPWSFIIVDDPEKTSMIAKAAAYGPGGFNSFTKEAGAFIALVAEKQVFPAWMAGKIRHVDYRHVDIGIACAHLVLQAHELGIGSCILGWFDEGKIKKILSVPRFKTVELVIALGHPAETEIHEKKLKGRSETVFLNNYQPPTTD
jgi:nitroreductase